jgi:Cu(I)/Ag(I) efflux system membrane fusion protein/cobalt-zinc-cadmium efflux system membrane fusion protein
MSEKTPNEATRAPSSRARGKRSDREARALALPPMNRGTQTVAVILVFGLGVALTALVLRNPLGLSFLPQPGPDHAGAAATPAAAAEPERLYQCPMHPEVVDSRLSDCPICGMKLAAVSGHAPEGADADRAIRIDPVQVQNIGVRSEPARRGEIARTVRTVGVLDFNADRITWINTKFSGWIEQVHVNYVGQEVRRDEPLFEIYSPELVTTQEEYLRALEYRASLEGSERGETLRQAESLLRSTRERLAYWDISEDQIRSLEAHGTAQRRLTVRAPADGVVTEVMEEALEGMFVRPGMNVYKLADLSSLWVHADVYESDLPWVREGQPATVSFRFDPDRSFRGAILFLYPEVSRETRTLKICVEVPNEQKRLKAGMYADVVVHGPPLRDALLIPYSAVLRSGERNLVFVDLGDGRFEPREVRLGMRGEGDVVQVLAGLESGEAVVTQAQFMLDSESRMQEAIAKFAERGTAGAREVAGHDHGE